MLTIMPGHQREPAWAMPFAAKEQAMVPADEVRLQGVMRRALVGGLAAGAMLALAACSSTSEIINANAVPPGPPQPATAIGSGAIKVGLILPLSAGGNAGAVAVS